MRIAVVAQKGGTGKTRAAVALATLLAEDGPTVLIDGDRQLQAITWRDAAINAGETWPDTLEFANWRDPLRLPPADLSHVVIDTGPGDPARAREALAQADIALVPIVCDEGNVVQIGASVADVERAAVGNDALLVGVLLTRVVPRTLEAREVPPALRDQGVPALDATIPNSLSIHGRAFGHGPSWRFLAPYRDVLAELRAPVEV